MHILLLILKIIGIILLIIAGLLLLAVITVLFVPVRYRILADYHGHFKGKLHVGWFFNLLRINMSYDKESDIRVKALFFTLYDSNKQQDSQVGNKPQKVKKKPKHKKEKNVFDEEKKEIASEELVITGDLGENIGQDKATGVINDIKTEIIKNNTQDNIQIADTINNITNNYNVTLTPEQQEKLENLMTKVSEQDYDYKEMKDALNSVKDVVNEKLDAMGEKVSVGFIESIKEWFTGLGDWFTGLFNSNEKDLGILETTNDDLLGDNVVVDATDDNAIKLPSSEETKGFFEKIWNWFTNLFNNNSSDINNDNSTNSVDSPVISGSENIESNDTIDDTLNPMDNNTTPEQDNSNSIKDTNTSSSDIIPNDDNSNSDSDNNTTDTNDN